MFLFFPQTHLGPEHRSTSEGETKPSPLTHYEDCVPLHLFDVNFLLSSAIHLHALRRRYTACQALLFRMHRTER